MKKMIIQDVETELSVFGTVRMIDLKLFMSGETGGRTAGSRPACTVGGRVLAEESFRGLHNTLPGDSKKQAARRSLSERSVAFRRRLATAVALSAFRFRPESKTLDYKKIVLFNIIEQIICICQALSSVRVDFYDKIKQNRNRLKIFCLNLSLFPLLWDLSAGY